MATVNGSLTILDAHKPGEVKVFWNGVQVLGVAGAVVDVDDDSHRVVLKVPEDPILAEMRAAGIEIRRI